MAEFGNTTGGGGNSSFGTGGHGEGGDSACMAHRAIDLYVQYSADRKTLTLVRWYYEYTVFCGKLADRTPGKGWPIWAYQLWSGKSPPDCIPCTGANGGSARADKFNSGYSYMTGEVPAGYNHEFRIKFGTLDTLKTADVLLGYKQDSEISSLKQLGCCGCCPDEKQYSQTGYDDETNVKNPNAGNPLAARYLSQQQTTDMMANKLKELDREVGGRSCCT